MTLESTTSVRMTGRTGAVLDPASQLLVQLTPGTRPAAIEKGIYALDEKYAAKDESFKGQWSYTLQPLRDLHSIPLMRPMVSRWLTDRSYTVCSRQAAFSLAGLINFINLTTAYAARRAKEIGIRKTMGSSRGQLVRQFLGETFLLTIFSAVVAVALIPLILRAFSGFIPEDIHFGSPRRSGYC